MKTLSRISASILLVLFFVVVAHGQTFTTAGGSVERNTDDRSFASVEVSGTHTGLGVAFEVSNSKATWYSVSCELTTIGTSSSASANANGIWVCPVGGIGHFRARIAALTTGSVTLHVTLSRAFRNLPTPYAVTSQQGGTWTTDTQVLNTINSFITNFGSNIIPAQGNGFSATTAFFTPPATPTDNCLIGGHASTTIKVTSAKIYGLATAARAADWLLIRRNTANTAGTFVAATIIGHDPDVASQTPAVGHYTANPTINSTVGNVTRSRQLIYQSSTLTLADRVYTELIPYGSVIELNGTAQQLAINFGGAALVGGESFACEFTWFEESE